MTLRPPRPPLLLAACLLLAALLLAPPASAREILHQVQKGQYLALIAERYHTTAAAIIAKNRLDPKGALKPGQTLVIDETEAHRRWRVFWEKRSGKKLDERVKPEAAPKEKKRAEAKNTAPKRAEAKNTAPKRAEAKNTAPKRAEAKPTADERRAEEAKKRAAAAAAVADRYARAPKKPGRVTLIRGQERYVGQLTDQKGQIDADHAKRVDRLLRSFRSGDDATIDRRLLSLLVRVSDHFGGRTIVVVSGYRPPSESKYTKDSRHSHGKAIDFRVVGVPTEVLFDFCKRLEGVGCGYYPTSGFVHMDVRARKTQWTDLSGPGEAPRYVHEIEKRKTEGSQAKSKRARAKR